MPRRRDEKPGGERAPLPFVAHVVDDPRFGGLTEIRRIQPFQARKTYLCPGCNNEIAPGTGHVVVVPLNDPPARRHWHSFCFTRTGAGGPRG